jgi:hypothetical protein
MDEFDQLSRRVSNAGLVIRIASRLSVLMDLEQSGDHRVVPFLLNILADPHETAKVRIYVLKQLRNARGLVAPTDGRPANAAGNALVESSNAELRIQQR